MAERGHVDGHSGKPAVTAPAMTGSVRFKTLGCKVNQVESDAAVARLLFDGWTVVEEDPADVVVVNTCTVTGEADAKARKAVRHAAALPEVEAVVVTGCLATLRAEALLSLVAA